MSPGLLGESVPRDRIWKQQYSCLEHPKDGGAWWAAVHGIAKSRPRLSDFTFTFHFSLSHTGEGNGNPLQCSCLENPRDGGAWWAAVYGITRSRTRLKWLSSSSSSLIRPELRNWCSITSGKFYRRKQTWSLPGFKGKGQLATSQWEDRQRVWGHL